MARRIRVAVVLILLIAVAVLPLATYRDYTGIYEDTISKRDTTIYIAVHYDAIDRATCINEIETQHKVVNKWESGFGYTFYLKGGKIYQMHSLDDCTAHATSYNCNAVSVCIHERDRYSPRTRANLYALLWFLKIKYRLSASQIVGHGELPGNNTKCPAMDMDSLRSLFWDF